MYTGGRVFSHFWVLGVEFDVLSLRWWTMAEAHFILVGTHLVWPFGRYRKISLGGPLGGTRAYNFCEWGSETESNFEFFVHSSLAIGDRAPYAVYQMCALCRGICTYKAKISISPG